MIIKSKEHSLKQKFFSKLGARFVNIPLNVALNMIVPRLLGTANFGIYNYLTELFTAGFVFLDSATSSYFYTRLSQGKNDKKYLWLYGCLIFFLIIFSIFVIAGTQKLGFFPQLWPNTPKLFVWYGLILGTITWLGQVSNKLVDALGFTVAGEIVRVCHRAINVAALGLFLFYGIDKIESFFAWQIVLMTLATISWVFVCRPKLKSFSVQKPDFKEFSSIGKDAWNYSSPLFLYSGIWFLGQFADRWILQTYFGSTEQGYFGLGMKVASVCFLFTGAMTPLLTREFAKASADRDLEKLRLDFCKFVPSFFLLAAYFGIFAMVNAELVTQLFGGQEFKDATIPVAIMCLYPIHQTYGQMSGSLFYATGRTRTYRNIGVINVLVGLGMTAFLILPRDIGGLGLGAEGVAIKMVGIQLIGVNIQLWYNSKYLKIKYSKFIIHQLVTIALFITIAIVIKYSFEVFVWGEVVKFVLTGILYTIGTIICVVIAPTLIGLSRSELNGIMVRLAAYVRHKG